MFLFGCRKCSSILRLSCLLWAMWMLRGRSSHVVMVCWLCSGFDLEGQKMLIPSTRSSWRPSFSSWYCAFNYSVVISFCFLFSFSIFVIWSRLSITILHLEMPVKQALSYRKPELLLQRRKNFVSPLPVVWQGLCLLPIVTYLKCFKTLINCTELQKTIGII